jgi:L-fuconolactonase
MADMMTRPQSLAWMDPGSGHREWLTLTTEEVIDPGLLICDPHHHLWKDRFGPYLVDQLHADTAAGHNVVSTVYIEAAVEYRDDGPAELQPVGETEFATAQARHSESTGGARVAAIVSFADVTLGERVEPVLAEHASAGDGLFRGVRYQAAWDPSPEVKPALTGSPGLLGRADFRAGLNVLAQMGLVFDAWVYHPQIREVTELARALPDLTIVLEHLGGPLGIGPYAGRRNEVREAWRPAIAEVASCPNVVMKLGGIGMGRYGLDWPGHPAPPTSEELAAAWEPEVHWCIEQFGSDRCMFESNFPVDGEATSYLVLWNAFKRLAAGASAGEKADLFHGTATRVYCLDDPAPTA